MIHYHESITEIDATPTQLTAFVSNAGTEIKYTNGKQSRAYNLGGEWFVFGDLPNEAMKLEAEAVLGWIRPE